MAFLKTLFIASIFLTGFGCAQHDERIYSLPAFDPGVHQSPINILTKATHEGMAQQHFAIHFQDKVSAVENLGHTVQLDFSQGSAINTNGINYQLKQMHFHTPSEHLIDGMTFPMELHIVSRDDNKAAPHYLVIGILFKMGKQNIFIKKFLDNVPKHVNEKANIEKQQIALVDLLPLSTQGNLGHYFHYNGSLTTPPYSENVKWFVLKTIHEASPEQIEAINQIEGNNARSIEAAHDRVVEDDQETPSSQ